MRDEWVRRIVGQEREASTRLVQAYTRTLGRLKTTAGALVDVMRKLDTPSAEQVRQLQEYGQMMTAMRVSGDAFAAILRDTMTGISEAGISEGVEAALEMAELSAQNIAGVIRAAWNSPDPAAVARVVAYMESSAMQTKLRTFGENAAQNVGDMVLAGVAQGFGPRRIAAVLEQALGMPYAWGENMARTVQIYSYRAATHAAYAANPQIISGWMWQSARDTRVCLSCLAQDGSVHGLDEVLNDHHRGRCAPVPIVRGTTWADRYVPSRDWFEGQPADVQAGMMGGAMYRAWKAGKVGWGEFSRPYNDDVYGEMRREASLREILGAGAAAVYYKT